METFDLVHLLRLIVESLSVAREDLNRRKLRGRDTRELPQLTGQPPETALLRLHEFQVKIEEGRSLHWRTKLKLQALYERAEPVAAALRVVSEEIPGEFDEALFVDQVIRLMDSLIEQFEVATRYYARRSNDSGPKSSRSGGARFPAMEDRSARSIDSELKDAIPYGQGQDELSLARSSLSQVTLDRQRIGSTRVPVFFGTTRQTTGIATHGNPDSLFLVGEDRASLSLGRAYVSIPAGHRIGNLEQPLGIWKLRLAPNPQKHFVVSQTEILEPTTWLAAAREELSSSFNRTAFVFIHGFNVSLSQAVSRAAQIARDIAFPGLVTCFSWSSQGDVRGYMADEVSVRLSIPALIEFFRKLHIDLGISELCVVAHSMGSRALLGGLEQAKFWTSQESPIVEAVFAAPDVDSEEYRATIPKVLDRARRFTLYGSERDWALALSRTLRKNYPRAGEGGANVLVLHGVQTVDATNAGEHMFGLGHSYFADKRTILGDLWAVVRGFVMPRFGLIERKHKLGTYWELQS